MYHFKETALVSGSVILDEEMELSGRTVRYLKDFQIGAVRFLYDHFRKREFCILNDESGLGKTAVAAVLLGIVAIERNCLIVVDNRDDHVLDWQFHLDILTDLNVNALNEEKDYDETIYSVYIVKWNTLRGLGDLSKMNFDIIVLDNREQILNNTFCMSTLLRNFEKKVHLVISSVDVTSDVKLLHNILRLGGSLEHQLESFKAFEQKFHLPDLKAISNKKSDLEEYFLKREILNDFCRGFRLRRYRHQYENFLPLVDVERYKAHLAHWCETKCIKKKPAVVSLSDSNQTGFRTEELLQQFVSQVDQNEMIDKEVEEITKNAKANGEERIRHSMTASNDEDMNMSPLVYLSESDKEEEVVMLSSNSSEVEIPIIEIEDGDTNNEDEKQKCTFIHLQVKETTKSSHENGHEHKTTKKDENHQKQKDTTESEDNTAEVSEKGNTRRRTRNRSTKLPNSDGMTTRRTLRKNYQSVIVTQNSTPRVGRKRTTNKANTNRSNVQQIENNKPEVVKNTKIEKISPKKSQVEKKSAKNISPTGDKALRKTKLPIATKDAKTPSIDTRDQTTDEKKKVPTASEEQKSNGTPSRKRSKKCDKLVLMSGIPLRPTRNTQRVTRSAGSKRKCFAFHFDDDKKPKTRVTPKKSPATKNTINKKNVKTTQTKSEESPKTTKQPTGRSAAPLSQASVLPTSSEYEEIPCGQKLVFDSSTDNEQLLEKPIEFLMPSTPPSMRISQYPLLQKTSARTVRNENNSDIMLLSNTSKTGQETITVLSSSNDEESLSSQTSTEQRPPRQLSGQKRKRYSKRKPVKQSPNFGSALAKERSLNKSPDLFSIASDTGNVIPFTQIHCQTLTSSSNKAFGFKIFGSEVRKTQEESSSQESSQRQSRANRSCLNILEQMFEKKNTTPASTLTRKRTLSVIDASKSTNASTKILATPRKPIHEMNQHTQSNGLTSEDIFEITSNTTFGSTLRINASGNISPVQQMSNSQHHNKITNYLIGSGNTKQNNVGDEEQHLLGTPSKRLSVTQQPGSGGTTVIPYTRKSPKSTKSTQATKLTKWFRRSSIDETTKDILKESKASKKTKRRRLDLSFKS